MKRFVALRGAPKSITTDNGGKFAGKEMEMWTYHSGVKLDLIRPSKPARMAIVKASVADYAMNA